MIVHGTCVHCICVQWSFFSEFHLKRKSPYMNLNQQSSASTLSYIGSRLRGITMPVK